MLNFDMVGRMKNSELMVYGTATASELSAMIDSANVAVASPLKVSGSGDGFGSSDHSSFYGKGIPVLHFFTDLHSDYHRASDDTEKINAGGAARVADLAFRITRRIDDRPGNLTFVRSAAPSRSRPGSQGSPTYLGSIPDMAAGTVPGLRLTGVRPGSPADSGGLKGGDIIVEFGGREVKDLYGYTEALYAHKPGDTVNVVFLREGKRTETTVTLGSRGDSVMPQPIPRPRASGFTETTTSPLYWCAYGPPDAARLLVLHGGPGAHHDYLLPQMLHLSKRYNLIFYDQRGGGRSKSDDREYVTAQTHVMDLHAVISEFALGAPSIVAYSFGGMLALLYAIKAKKNRALPNLARLALIDTAPLRMAYRKEFESEFARRQNGMEIRRLREELAASGLREKDREEYRQRTFELAVAPYFADPKKARDLTPFAFQAACSNPPGRASAPITISFLTSKD